VRYGEVLIFDGGYLSHGTVSNQTQTTRVSLDMRFCLKGAATRLEGVDLMNILAARLGTGHQPRRNGDRRLR
jgi:ectoine hydroxylase-related dioxygenase (phytanoyl-CoA dioxygenase family)